MKLSSYLTNKIDRSELKAAEGCQVSKSPLTTFSSSGDGISTRESKEVKFRRFSYQHKNSEETLETNGE